MPGRTRAVPAEAQPTMLAHIGLFLRKMMWYLLCPVAAVLAFFTGEEENKKKKNKQQAAVDLPDPGEMLRVWEELARVFPEELILRIENHANNEPHTTTNKLVVYLVLHGVAGEPGSEATDTHVVGAFTTMFAANIRVLGYTRALIREVYGLDRVQDANEAEDFWWCTALDGVAGTQFLAPCGDGHNVYATAVEIHDSGFVGGTQVACPSRRCWNWD
ncbi:hypothetical protein F4809DRAFT_666278 [Biscogniauxia mediterranea]|nr:hypothetical protein F4809DRAFT_666278 [Biscogniauxia mediterranea]